LKLSIRNFFRKVPRCVIVYQMGKVGSKTICRSILNLRKFKVYHFHTLNKKKIASTRNDPRNKPQQLDHLKNSEEFIEEYLSKQKPFSVITLVRDPIAKKISGFFEMLHKFIPKPREVDQYETDELIRVFFENYKFLGPGNWFDSEMKKHLGFDIFATPFPKKKGYQIIRTDRFPVLAMKLETTDAVKARALTEFLKVPEISLNPENIAKKKYYSQKYKDFQQKIRFPEEYLDKIYTSKMAMHFYSPDEIAAFRERWSKEE